jgi:hypothetical protein
MAAHRALIVIGMHRSGTSALTRVVNILGAALPSQLLELDPAIPHETNELGFWEGLEVNTLNNEFLSSIGSSWDDTARIPETVFRSDAARSMRDRIVRHLEAEFKDAPLFAIKDPRIARLAPLWIEALKAFGAEANFILAFRNPAEVAQSLLKRDQMGRGQSTLLWLRYMLEAERNTRNFRRSFVPYEALLENWRGAARRIAEDCDFVWPRFNAGAELAIDAFVSADRRHNLASDSQWAEFPQWPHNVHDVFQVGASGACLDVDVVDRISAELDRAGEVFDGYICELDLKVRTKSNELKDLELALVQHQKEGENLQSELDRIRFQFDQLDRSSGELQAERDRLEAETHRFAIELETERTSRVALEERSRQLAAALSDVRDEVAQQQAELEAASTQVQKLLASEQERGQLQAAAHRFAIELETERTSRAALEERSRQLEVALSDVRGEVSQQQAELKAASIQAQKLLASEQERSHLEQRLSQAQGEARTALLLRRRLEEANGQRDHVRLEVERNEVMLANVSAALAATKITLSTMAKKLQSKTLDAKSVIAELAKTRSELHLERERADGASAVLASAFSELHIPREGTDDAVTGLPTAHYELAVLKQKLRERDELKAQLEALLSSRTWRLTKPVRRLMSKIKITFARRP